MSPNHRPFSEEHCAQFIDSLEHAVGISMVPGAFLSNFNKLLVSDLQDVFRGVSLLAERGEAEKHFMFGLQSRLPVQGATWDQLRELDLAGRLAAIGDEQMCARLVEEAQRKDATGIPMEQVFYLGTGPSPDYTAAPQNNLQAMSAAAGEHWSEMFLRLSRESGGKGLKVWTLISFFLEGVIFRLSLSVEGLAVSRHGLGQFPMRLGHMRLPVSYYSLTTTP